MVNIQVKGRGYLSQDGRTTVLQPGAMTMLDSTRPYSLRFSGAFSQYARFAGFGKSRRLLRRRR
jgi:AraC-binding-like domain